MTKENEIKFTINDINALKNISNEMQLLVIPGYIDITIGSENITRPNGNKILNDGRIMEVALSFQTKLLDLLKADQASIKIDYGDYWEISFDRKGDSVYCSIFDKDEKKFVSKDKNMPIKDYLKQMFVSTQTLEDEILSNPFTRGFKVLKVLRQNMDENLYEAKKQRILTQEDVNEILKEYSQKGDIMDYFT